MDESPFDRAFNRICKIMEWWPVFFAGFAIAWTLLWLVILILVVLALTKYLNLW